MIQDYNTLAERLAKVSGLTKEEIERRVEAKRAKLSGLISKEGAIQIIAAEIGINFDKQKVKINEIMPGLRKINLTAKIVQLFSVKSYKKNEREGKLCSMIVADDTGNVRVVLWDTNHIQLVENGTIKQGDVVEISNASLRNNELHLSGFSDIKTSSEVIENVNVERQVTDKKLAETKVGDGISSRAIIMQVFEPRFFHVCPECKKKAIPDTEGHICEAHGRVNPERRAILTVVLDDGTDNMRGILFSDQISMLGINELEGEGFLNEKKNLLGKEAMFNGSIRQNKMFNNREFFIDKIEEINVEQLIEKLEKA